MTSGMCENCPRRPFDERLTRVLTSDDALLKNGGQLALDIMGLARCSGRTVHEDTEGEREFGHSDYYDCPHPTQSLAETVLAATELAANRDPNDSIQLTDCAPDAKTHYGSPEVEAAW